MMMHLNQEQHNETTDGTTWTRTAFLKASNAEENYQFGTSVSISGDTIVVGAQFESSPANTVMEMREMVHPGQEQHTYLSRMELHGVNKPISK
jgi:hypothetical protein